MFKEWVIDIGASHFHNRVVCFVPIERPDTIVIGMYILSDRCPGELVGLIHGMGQSAVDEWELNNPDWYEKYAPPDADEGRKGC
jgi:hypothetical protein